MMKGCQNSNSLFGVPASAGLCVLDGASPGPPEGGTPNRMTQGAQCVVHCQRMCVSQFRTSRLRFAFAKDSPDCTDSMPVSADDDRAFLE
jgi:hypothetical protein